MESFLQMSHVILWWPMGAIAKSTIVLLFLFYILVFLDIIFVFIDLIF